MTAKSEDVCTWLDEPLVNLLCSLSELLTGNFLFSICTTVWYIKLFFGRNYCLSQCGLTLKFNCAFCSWDFGEMVSHRPAFRASPGISWKTLQIFIFWQYIFRLYKVVFWSLYSVFSNQSMGLFGGLQKVSTAFMLSLDFGRSRTICSWKIPGISLYR